MELVEELISNEEPCWAKWALIGYIQDPEKYKDPEPGKDDEVLYGENPPPSPYDELVGALEGAKGFTDVGFVQQSLWFMYLLKELVLELHK